jgi:DNA gyrase/topoisomerase IV subunit A
MGRITAYVADDGRALAAPADAPAREVAPLRLAGARLVAVLRTEQERQLDVFTENGLCYRGSLADFAPETTAGDGEPLVTLIEGDRVCAVQPVEASTHYAFVTEDGVLKRIERRAIAKADADGIAAFTVPMRDRIVDVVAHGADDDLLISTAGGKLLRVDLSTVRPVQTGDAGGVAGIALAEGDRVVSAVRAAGEDLLVVHERGAAKRVPLAEYPRKGRATGGVVSAHVDRPTRGAGPAGPVAGAWPVFGDPPLLFSEQGRLIPLDRGQVEAGARAAVSRLAFAFALGDRPRGLVQTI